LARISALFRNGIAVAVILVLLGAAASSSFAASDPTDAQYNPNAPSSVSSGGSSGQAQGSASPEDPVLDRRVGSLPFTGLDLLGLVGVALALTAVGFGVRSLSRPRGG
jgi:hypothetical protein